MNKKTTIILSTYNESLAIEYTITELIKHIKNLEIVVVDDNSPDGTFEILKKINYPHLKIFCRKKTRGLASAFLLGLINSEGDTIGWLDSNMGSLASKFPEMISNLNDYDIVLLSRYVQGGGDQRNKVRIIASKMVNFISRFILRSLKDLTSGIFVMKREVLLDVLPIASGHGEFIVEFLHQAELKKNKILEIPYIQPIDIEKIVKVFLIYINFCCKFFYILRLIQAIFRR